MNNTKYKQIQKQIQIEATWEEYEAYEEMENRSYLKDFDRAELEWEYNISILRYERRESELISWISDSYLEAVANYIIFLENKAAGDIESLPSSIFPELYKLTTETTD